MTTYKHLPHPAPPKVRRSQAERALESKMDQRFKSNFDKLFRSTAHRSPLRKADDIDAKLERALVLAKRIGDARRQHQADQLHKARALCAETHELLEKCLDLDLDLADVNTRLDRLELENSWKIEGANMTNPQPRNLAPMPVTVPPRDPVGPAPVQPFPIAPATPSMHQPRPTFPATPPSRPIPNVRPLR